MKKQILFFGISIFIIFLLQFFIKNPIFNRIFFNNSENHISNFLDLDEKILLKGKICGEVDRRIFKTNYVICSEKILKIGNKNLNKDINGKFLLSTSLYPEYKFGDVLKISGKLKTPFENNNFSYKNFLLMDGIFGYLNYGKVDLIYINKYKKSDLNNEEDFSFLKFNLKIFGDFFSLFKEDFFLKKIFQFKKNFLERIEEIYPSPHSAFLAGLLIGDRKGLPDDIKSDFQKNGLAHIVAISGYNITIIIILISGFFFFLPKRFGIILSVFFIILFTIFVGGTSAVVRASVMGILGLLAIYFGREKNALIVIMLSILIMSLRNPMLLWWDIGFHLSILAVIGIIYLVKIFEKLTEKIGNNFGIKEIILMTVSASLMTFPIISYNFGMVSLISPIANLFVAPLTPLAMLFGFFSIFSSYFNNFTLFYFFQEFFGFLTYSILDLALNLSHYFANLKYSFIEYQISIFGVIFYYLILLFVFRFFRKYFS